VLPQLLLVVVVVGMLVTHTPLTAAAPELLSITGCPGAVVAAVP
jgi:hypothetical protein